MSEHDVPFNILVVDDDLNNIQVGINILKKQDNYHMIFATSGEQALERIKEYQFDLILLDIIMQPMNGFDVCKIIKSNPLTSHIPVIFLTAKTESESMIKGFELGGADYVTKPFNSYELGARVKTHLSLKKAYDQEIEETQKEVIMTFSHLCEFKSVTEGKHIERVAEMSALLAKMYGLDHKACSDIRWASPLHDVGNITIPDHILHKPAKLTDEEFELVKQHTVEGYKLLLGSKRHLLRAAAEIAYQHHERWDGTGYPQQLAEKEIDIRARIVAVCDVFDTLIHKRVYKDAWTIDDAKAYMQEAAGSHFDPHLVTIFLDEFYQFEAIINRLQD